MEAKHWNPPLVHFVGIEFAKGLGIRNHLATAGKSNRRAVHLPSATFQLHAVSFFVAAENVEHSHAGHVATAPQFNVVAARKIILAIELPPRNVVVHAAHAIVIVRGHFFEYGNFAPAVAADGIRQIFADVASGVAKPIRKQN